MTRCSLLLTTGVFAAWLTGFAVADAQPRPAPLVPEARSYVPLEDLDAVIERDRAGVLLPKAEFLKLLKAAEEQARKHPPAPLPMVLARGDYRCQIVGDQLLISATAHLEQLRPDWQVWSFSLPRLALERATINGQPAQIARNSDGSLQVFTSSVGRHELVLELSTELVSLGSDQAAGFALLPAAAGELTLSVPAGKRLMLDGTDLARPTPIAEPAEYRVPVGGRKQVQIRLTDRVDQQRTDALVFASTGYGLVVAPGEVTWHALTTLQVFGRALDRVTLSVPATLEIADVESTGLEAWELSDSQDAPPRTILTLTYGQPIDGARRIAVRGVMAVPAGQPWTAPPLSIANVSSHVGQIVIQHPAAVRLQTLETEGVRRATAGAKPVSDMPENMGPVEAASTLRFDAWREDFTLRLVAEPKQRELHVAVAGVLDLASKQAELQAAFTVATRFAPLFDFDVDVPAEWSVLGATAADNQPLKWQVLPQSPGINRIRVPLSTALAAGGSTVVNLQFRYSGEGWPIEQTAVDIALPEMVVPQATLVETALVVRGDGDLELTASDVVGLDPVPLKAEWERLRFQSQDTRYSARLKIARKPAELASESVAYYRLDPQTLHAWLQMVIEATGGGLRSVEVSLPESVGENVRFSVLGATLVEQQPLPPANGRRAWRLVFGERVFGRFAVQTDIERPRAGTDAVSMPVLEVAGATRAHGAFVIEAGPEQQLTIKALDAQSQPLLEIDPIDLPRTRYTLKERIVAAYRAIGTGNTVTLTEQRFGKSAVPTALCTGLNVLTIASRTGELQHQADFALRLSGVQQLQVVLPESAELWGALLNNQPVEIRRAGTQLLIPLALDAAGESSATLQLFYRQTDASLTGVGTLEQLPPALAVHFGSGTSQTVEILEQSWRLVHPADTLVVDSHTSLEPETALDVPGWLILIGKDWPTPTRSQLVWGGVALIVTAGFWALLLLISRQWGQRRLGWLTLMILCVAPFGLCFLLLPAVQQSKSAAMRAQARHDWTKARLEGSGYFAEDFGGVAATPVPTGAPMPAAVELNADAPTPPMAGVPILSQTPHTSRLTDEKAANNPRFAKEQASERLRRKAIDALPPLEAAQKSEPQVSLEIRQQQELEAIDKAAAPAKPNRPVMVNGVIADPFAVAGEPAVVARGRTATALGFDTGLLSLALNLELPPDAREKLFRYVGSGAVGQGLPLRVDYVDRRGGVARRLALLAFGAVVAWGVRRRSWVWKTALAGLGLAASLGLMPLAPVAWQPWLDGVFAAVIGAIAAWCLWTCGRALEAAYRWINARAVAASVLLAIACGLQGGLLSAQTAKVAPPPPPQPIPPTVVEVTGSDPLVSEQVFLPQAKFVELYRLAHPEKSARTPAPTNGGLVAALYSGELSPAANGGEATILFRARYALHSTVDGQLSLPLPIRDVALRSAVLNDGPAALDTSGATWTVLLPKPGLHILDLEFAIPAKLTGAAGSFALTTQPTPAARLSFKLPESKLTARVNGSTTVYRRVTRDDATFLELPVDRGGDLRVSWQPDQARGGAAVVHVESTTAVTATDAGAAVSTGFRYRVRQGVVRDLSFDLPEAVKLRTVTGPDVGGWELVGDAAARKLRVFLRRNVGDQTELTIDGFLNAQLEQDTSVSVPGIVPLEITAEVGHVAVYAGAQFAVRAEKTDALTQVNAPQFTPAVPVTRLELPPQLAYRFNRRPWTLDLRISRLATQLRVAVHQGVRVSHRKTQITAKVVCDLSLVPRSNLELVVPAGWLVLDVQSPGLRDWYRTVADNQAVLTLDYEQPQKGSLTVVVLASETRPEATTAVSIASPQVRAAQRFQRQVAVWFDPGLSGRVASLGGWRAVDPASVAGELAQLRRVPVQLALESNSDSPANAEVTVEQSQPRLAADSLSVVTVTDVGVVNGLVLQWKIDQAATETLTFETPSWLSGRLQFDRSHIRDVTESVSADGGVTRWTVRLRGPVSDKFLLAASAITPPATDRVLAPGLRFLSLDGQTALDAQRHYVLLSNASLSQLTNENPALSEPIQREDVELVVRPELVQQATEFVRVKTPGRAPTWSLQRYVPTASIPAAVNLADFTTVLARDGSYRTSATLTLKNRARQFLAVRLPTGTRLLSVLVSGQPSRSVETTLKGGAAQLIALPKTSAVDLSFPVQIIYSGQLDRPLPQRANWQAQTFDVPALAVIDQQESPDFGIPVARTQWTVYLPDDLFVAALPNVPSRHNLNRSSYYQPQESLVHLLLCDAEQVAEALSDITASNGRMRAYNNLKQLDSALRNYSEYTIQNPEYQKRAEAARKNLEELEQSIAGRGTATGSGAILLTPSQDASVQFGNAVANNAFIFNDNRSSGAQLGDQLDTTFNFTVPNAEAKPASGPRDARELAKQATELGRNSISVEARQQYQALNEDSLSRLNTAIAGKKLADQQVQQRAAGTTPLQAGQAGGQFGALQDRAEGEQLRSNMTRNLTRGDVSGPASGGLRGLTDGGDVRFGMNRWFDSDHDGIMPADDMLDFAFQAPVLAEGAQLWGGAMGGGGFGGGGGVGGGVGEQATRGWTQTGGLSLQFAVPTDGQSLVFSKAGGDAKLALSVRPQASVSLGLGGLWSLGWLIAAVSLLLGLRTAEQRRRWAARLPLIVCVCAAAVVLLAPVPWSLIGWIIFAVTAGWVAWQQRKPAMA